MARGRCIGSALVLLLMCTAAWAQYSLIETRPALVEVVVAYGRANLDEGTSLIKDRYGDPNLVDSSIGFVAAALAGNDGDQEMARGVLEAVLANQDVEPGSGTQGTFRWRGNPEADYQPDAVLYVAPLLAYVTITYGEAVLGEELNGKLLAALGLCKGALQRRGTQDEDSTTRLLRAAALSAIGRALDDTELVRREAGLTSNWGREARHNGVPEGHNPTYDALKVAAVRWVQWAGGTGLERAYELLWLDFVQRVDASGSYLGGAMTAAFPGDYASGSSVARYLIHYDLGGPEPTGIEPFAVYLLAPPAPQFSVSRPPLPTTITTACQKPDGVTRTDTFINPHFTLGTLSGQIGDDSILGLVTYSAGGRRPTSYFYLHGGPAHVTSIQHGSVAVVSADFDLLGVRGRRQAWLEGILGPRNQIERVLLFGEEWPGYEVGVEEMSSLAVQTRDCYLGVRPLHCGAAQPKHVREGPKPATLGWIGEGDQAELALRIYARKETSLVRRPLDNMRAGFMVRIAPLEAFESLEKFSRALTRARIVQTVQYQKKRLREEEATDKPPMLTEWKPKSKSDLVYQHLLVHTIKYTADDLAMELVEDMRANKVLSRTINGEAADAAGPWSSPLLTIPWPAG